MGLRFRKSFKVAPGVKVNLNKKSAGVTVGTKGAHLTVNTSGKRTASVGIPGTGLSYSTSSGGGKKGAKKKQTKKDTFNKLIGIVIAVVAIACTAGAIKNAYDKKHPAETVSGVTVQQDVSAANTSNVSAADNAAAQASDTGSNTSAAAQTADTTDAESTTVYISGSGAKYHLKADCSGMENASAVTLQEALDMGREACKRCAQ